jgi:hypothetical protein
LFAYRDKKVVGVFVRFSLRRFTVNFRNATICMAADSLSWRLMSLIAVSCAGSKSRTTVGTSPFDTASG